MKRFTALFLAIVFCLSLVACDNKKHSDQVKDVITEKTESTASTIDSENISNIKDALSEIELDATAEPLE